MEFLHITLTGWVALSIALSMVFLAGIMFMLGTERFHYIWGVFCVAIAVWASGFYMVTLAQDPMTARFWWQISYIGTILNPFLYFHFTLEFIQSALFKRFKRLILSTLYVVAITFIYLNFATDLIVNQVTFLFGQIFYDTPPGKLYLYFMSLFLVLILVSLVLIAKKYKESQKDYVFRQRAIYFFIASAVAYLGGSMNFLPVYGIEVNPVTNFSVAFGAVFIAYAILRRGLFDVRIVTAQVLTLILSVFMLIRLLVSGSMQEIIFNVLMLAVTIAIGVYLILSVRREVEQRAVIEKQEKELEEANKKQENLIHFISHEIKGYLAKNAAAFAGAAEGDYGQAPPELKAMAEMALADTRKGVDVVMDILSASNFKKGTVNYAMQPFDFRAEVVRQYEEFKSAAEEKKLSLTIDVVGSGNYMVVGDAIQLGKHVIHNLIDNAIKYTPQGEVHVALARKGSKLVFSVKDSGVGITDEDKRHLFTEGGRGKDSIKVNAHSTGYGLFIARSIVDAHHGRVWVESAGAGKGSTFYVELPAKE